MRDNTFTPGPWEIDRNKGGSIEGIGPLLAEEYAGSAWLEVSEGNAHLIASAPDLYNALWEAVELSDRRLPESGRTAECQRVYDLCVAALKKAEGE